jgi:hypothetical protein
MSNGQSLPCCLGRYCVVWENGSRVITFNPSVQTSNTVPVWTTTIFALVHLSVHYLSKCEVGTFKWVLWQALHALLVLDVFASGLPLVARKPGDVKERIAIGKELAIKLLRVRGAC